MMTWLKDLIRGSVAEKAVRCCGKRQPLSRQEVSELFFDELARPALQKRTRTRRKQPRRLMAGCRTLFT